MNKRSTYQCFIHYEKSNTYIWRICIVKVICSDYFENA